MVAMNDADKIAFKNRLKQFCADAIAERIAAAETAIKAAQEAANNEEKSSAGDKYETGRAMGHLQKDMHTRQLAACLKEKAAVQTVNTGFICNAATAGAFVETAAQCFFIAAGLGRQVFDAKEIIFISPLAPLAGLLQHKKAGEWFRFNNQDLPIIDIF
jgi:hypothetical protein